MALAVKKPPVNAQDIRDADSIPGLGRSPGGGCGNPLHYSCLENPMGWGALRSTILRVARSCIQLKQLSTHAWARNNLKEGGKKKNWIQNSLDHKEGKGILEKHLLCFIDYSKIFDWMNHNKVWKILKEMRIPDHFTCLLRNLYKEFMIWATSSSWSCFFWCIELLHLWLQRVKSIWF